MIKMKTLLEQAWKNPQRELYWIDRRVPSIAAQFGETVDRILGAGYNGMAYLLTSGKVLKVTPDRNEVAAASRYRTRQASQHVVRVYDVRPITGAIIDPEDAEASDDQKARMQFGATWYAIIMDYVTPFTPYERLIWEYTYADYLNTRYSDQDVMMEIQDAIENTKNLSTAVDMPASWIDNIIAQRTSLLAAFRRHRIYASEAHDENMGWNAQHQLVHFDFWMRTSGDIATSTIQRVPRRLNKPVQFDATGIDTPNNPDM
jgi:hypothetical protein